MAYTFLDAVAATGQRISAFFQTLTIFLLDHTLRPAFSLFSGNFNIPLLEGPPPQQAAAGEEQQEHPHTELEQSQQQPQQPQHQLDVQDQNSVTTTPATTSQSQSKNQSEDASAANSDALPQASFLSLTPEQANSSKLPDTEPDMVRTSSATATLAAEQQPLKKIPVPNVVPALPLAAPAKENAAPVKAVAASADSENKLTGDLERLSIATDAAAVAATGAVGSGDWVPATQQPSEFTQDNNTTPAAAADGASDAEPRQLLKTNVLHGHGPSTSVGWNIVDSLPRAPVVRSPAVPINHELSQTSQLKEGFTDSAAHLEAELETPEEAAERAMHAGFMREALDMARLALKTNETPVGCVLVYKDRVIARGMNATNVSRNGTRHAELMAICALLSYSGDADLEPKNAQHQCNHDEPSVWGDIDPGDGHLFPYGQKLHPAPRVDRSVISECTLYVTVEPCVMCASLLRQLRIKKVYFGAVNDKFGGTGGVFRIHKNSPISMASAPPSPAPQNGKGIARPALERRPVSALNIGTGGVEGQEPEPVGDENDESKQNETVGEQPGQDTTSLFEPELHGDGGNVEPGYEVEGGWGRDEAVTLLRQFYVQENGRAPVPRKKEGRAARLAAMMERDGHAGGPMADAPAVAKPEENGASVEGDAAAQEGEEKSEEKTEEKTEEENSGNSSDA